MTRRPQPASPNRITDAVCQTCAQPVILLWDDADGSQCWFCATGEPRPVPRTTPLRKPDDDVWMWPA